MKLCEKIFNSRGKLLVFLFVFMFFYPYSQFKVNVVRYSRVFTKLAMNNQITFFFYEVSWKILTNSGKFDKNSRRHFYIFLKIMENDLKFKSCWKQLFPPIIFFPYSLPASSPLSLCIVQRLITENFHS